jgi:peptidoglycan hydrolase-like protein with peptidoglycan-binding domain
MTRRGVLSTLLAAAVLVGTGAAAALLVRSEPVPAVLRGAPEPTSAATGTQSFDDPRTAQATLLISGSVPLSGHVSGTVTATACTPGRAVVSGSMIVSVDDQPVIALRTSLPLYRDLGRGDAGHDVSALQAELGRLGYDTNTDGHYTGRTARAVTKFFRARGHSRPDGQVRLAQLAWLPDRTVTPGTCPLIVGTAVSSGTALATVPGRLRAVRLTALPDGLVSGDRTLTLFAVNGPLGPGGTATDRRFLSAVEATPEFRARQAAASSDPLQVDLALTHPLATVKVPPAAVFALHGTKGCLQSGDRVIPVTVIGSALGASLVTLSGAVPETVNLGRAATATTCG